MSDLNNTLATLQEWEGKIVPRDFSPGFVVLSYLVSYVGAWTTLELINRRTAGRGLYNWFLLIGSSISMGGISVWCMHYIGNRAVTLGGGIPIVQISYNKGFTALSFFVPIVVLFAAFLAIGSNESVSTIRIALGGALAGLAICGMHYLGQAGISNYDCVYETGHVAGSAVIAVFASITALSVFFGLRARWTNSWWKRALTAVILAGAVTGMHFVAAVGTQYRLKVVDPSSAEMLSANSTVIVVIVLSVASCFILMALTIFAQRRRLQSADRAQQVVLAAVIFDNDGKLMVTPEGLLPNQKITNSYVEMSFGDIFGISHPVFLWIFRISRSWSSISALLPQMRNHIQNISVSQRSRPTSRFTGLELTDDAGEPIEDYSVIFRELFCVAAAGLADQLNEHIENIGVLFDEILSTGQAGKQKSKAPKSVNVSAHASVDIERDGLAPLVFGRGQLLFLVRHANRREADNLQAAGYRFASIQNVVDILARTMQINCDDLAQRLLSMREYASETHILEPGAHMACFAIRANVTGGFDVLVRKDARNQLPTMQLPFNSLEPWQADYLAKFDGLTVATCIGRLKVRTPSSLPVTKEQTFSTQLLETIEALRDQIDDPFFQEAMLIAKPVQAPCRGKDENAKPSLAELIVFRIILPIHSRASSSKLEFTPLSFFKVQQHVYKNSPDHAVFARKIHREFGPILNQTYPSVGGKESQSTQSHPFSRNKFGTSKTTLDSRSHTESDFPIISPDRKQRNDSKRDAFRRFWSRSRSESLGQVIIPHPSGKNSDTSSEKNLVESQTFGGIMVSQEVTVDIRDIRDNATGHDHGLDVEMVDLAHPGKRSGVGTRGEMQLQLGSTGVATKEVEDPQTYVDKLFTISVENR